MAGHCRRRSRSTRGGRPTLLPLGGRLGNFSNWRLWPDRVLILLTVVLVTILYSRGETAAGGVLAFARRLGGDTGERTVYLAAQAIRSVALGVVVTAFVQALLAGVGLWFSGVPHPGFLTAIAFIFGIAQLGPLLILSPAILWLYWTGAAAWGTGLLIWSLPVAALNNVMRPILIRRGVQLPRC